MTGFQSASGGRLVYPALRTCCRSPYHRRQAALPAHRARSQGRILLIVHIHARSPRHHRGCQSARRSPSHSGLISGVRPPPADRFLAGRHIDSPKGRLSHHFRVTDLLVTEQQHKVVYQGLADSAVGDVIHIRQVHALDLAPTGPSSAASMHRRRRLRGFCIHRNILVFGSQSVADLKAAACSVSTCFNAASVVRRATGV